MYASSVFHCFVIHATYLFWENLSFSVLCGFHIFLKGATFWSKFMKNRNLLGSITSYKIWSDFSTMHMIYHACIHRPSFLWDATLFGKIDLLLFLCVAFLSFGKERLFRPTLWKTRNMLGLVTSYTILESVYLAHDIPRMHLPSFIAFRSVSPFLVFGKIYLVSVLCGFLFHRKEQDRACFLKEMY